MGFLDPELMSTTNIDSDKSYVVEYVTKVMVRYGKKKIIMFAYNPGDH